ncbi:RHS repeat-associated core domain-containing protein [Wukongibacter sp. M2B1]|uniref:RHS repeat-associated core domain-containing protein n=1 Tax=Wukongibacter sp. M2B1 TaxID=3088895 RepID=UPI003D7B877F
MTGDVFAVVRGYNLIAQKNRNKELSYYLHNRHGDVVNMVEGNGTLLNSYKYDAFGNIRESEELVPNRFKYAGEQFDNISGMYYLRGRHYKPEIGRFIQEDPYRGDGLNLYAYVANNPVNFVDPSGYWKDSVDEGKGEISFLDSIIGYIRKAGDNFTGFVDGAKDSFTLGLTSMFKGDDYKELLIDEKLIFNKEDYDAGYKAGKNFMAVAELAALAKSIVRQGGKKVIGIVDDLFKGADDIVKGTKNPTVEKLTELLKNGKRKGKNIISQIDDKTQVVFRQDTGVNAHPMKTKGYEQAIDHYNIEIQTKTPAGKWSHHIILDEFKNVIDFFE